MGVLRIGKSEVVLALGVLLLVFSTVAPAVWAYRNYREQASVMRDIHALLQAGYAFYREYGLWPGHPVTEVGDVRFGHRTPNRACLDVLRALETPDAYGRTMNAHHLVLLEPPAWTPGQSGVDASGEYLDLWGTPYQIVIDADLSTYCDIPDSAHGSNIPEGMLVWSCGPDRISDTADDIISWKR